MIKLLVIFLSIVSFSAFGGGENCSPANKDTYFWYEGKTIPKVLPKGGGLSPQWTAKCQPLINVIAQNDEVQGSTMTCSECYAKYYGRDRYRLCDEAAPCQGNGSSNLVIEFLKVGFAKLVAQCPQNTYCSNSTNLCEYTCPDGFSYSTSSGYCEKQCPENNIAEDANCVPCGDNEIADEDENECVACEEGKIVQNGQCVEACPIEGQNYVNNECKCPEGMEIVNFQCKAVSSNPCGGVQMPYYENGQIVCKFPSTRTGMLTPSLNSNGYRADLDGLGQSTNYSGSVSFVGCKKNQGQQQALLKIETNGYDVESVRTYRAYAYCVDGSSSANVYGQTDKAVGYYPAMIGTSAYITVPGIEYCYKYRYVTFNGFTRGEIGTVTIPYETCSECAEGLVKINGVCTCPQGQSLVDGVCKAPIKCQSAFEFAAGKCECGGLVYTKPGFLSQTEYTCATPPYNWFDMTSFTSTNQVTITASRTRCENITWGSNSVNRITFDYSANSNHDYPVELGIICVGGSFNKPTAEDLTFIPSRVGGLGTLFSRSSKSGSFTIDADGSCYKYKLAAKYFYGWVGNTSIDLEYPTSGCQNLSNP